MPNTFIAAITDPRKDGADYIARVRERLHEAGFDLDDGGLLTHADGLVGFYRFLDLDDGYDLLPAEAVALVERPPPCPGIGPVVGYFTWSHPTRPELAQRRLVPAIIAVGRGLIARTDDGRFRTAVNRIEFKLSDLFGKYGFGDGGALLSRDPDYLEYVRDEASTALAAAGFAAEVGIFDSSHNPVRIVGDVKKDGQLVEDSEITSELFCHPLTIWTYDPALPDDFEFWY